MTKYLNLSNGLVRDWVPVTPNNDANNVPAGLVGFFITGTGTITFTVDGTDRLVTVPANFTMPCNGATRVKAAGTTATGIFALTI
jgi:hypothetical protein